MKLKEAITQIEQSLEQHPDKKGLEEAKEILRAFGKPVKYNNMPYYIAAAVFALLFLLLVGSDFPDGWVYIVLIGLFIISIWIPLSRIAKLNDLANRMHYIDLLADNGIEPLNKSIRYFSHRYFGFLRGDHANTIENSYQKSAYVGKEYTFDAVLFSYRFTNKRVVPYPCGKSGRRTCHRVEYDHYYRYGVEIPFAHVSEGIGISSDNFAMDFAHAYQSESLKFNKCCKAFGDDEMVLAKFMKPTVILRVEALAEDFSDLSIQCLNQKLCIMFSNNDVMPHNAKRTYGLDKPHLFLEELEGHSKLEQLDAIYDFAEYLLRYTDSNFKTSKE